jgi:flagellar basal-body rod protein FlgB
MNVDANNVGLLVRLMSAATERGKVIANNVANESTPGYKRQVLSFEEQLRTALDSGQRDLAKVQPQLVEDTLTPAGKNGNNVNLELELNAGRQNRLLYDTYASILQGHFEMLRTSIESGR